MIRIIESEEEYENHTFNKEDYPTSYPCVVVDFTHVNPFHADQKKRYIHYPPAGAGLEWIEGFVAGYKARRELY